MEKGLYFIFRSNLFEIPKTDGRWQILIAGIKWSRMKPFKGLPRRVAFHRKGFSHPLEEIWIRLRLHLPRTHEPGSAWSPPEELFFRWRRASQWPAIGRAAGKIWVLMLSMCSASSWWDRSNWPRLRFQSRRGMQQAEWEDSSRLPGQHRDR